jgi:endogenous inhibitor of DNA gyrase (YacG/DUF329 family)
MKGKCTNCGKPMKEESNENWKVYCTSKECQKAFLQAVLKKGNK